MAITNQPAEDSLYSAYSQIPVETDNSTSGLEIKTQNFDEDDMISLNIIDNEAVEVLDNSGGSSNDYSVKFPLRRKVIPMEWYAFRVSKGVGVGATSLTVALFQATSSGNLTTVIAKTNIPIGDNMTWKVQIPRIVTVGSPRDFLVIFAGIEGATAGVKVTLSGMSLAYGNNFVDYSPSPVKAANSLTESIDIYRDSGFGTMKKYDLSFLAKAGFRDDRFKTFPYIDPVVGFAIDYSLISAYAYRYIGERNFNVRYASRGVRARGYKANFTESYLGLVLTDRVPDNDRNLYVKKYPEYPYFVTLFPRGFVGSSYAATSIDVRVKHYEDVEKQFDISTRLNIPLVYEFEDADASEDEADYVKLRPSGGEYSSQAWNIIFVNTEAPCNPFYIRWINQKGGWDTYMFEQHKKYAQEVDRGDQYVLANSRGPYASQTRGELAPEFKNIVQAGAEQLDENDFNLLKGIALSPLVQRFNDSIGVWQRVLVNDTDLTWDTKTPRNTVSYEFQLIDEQTQW
ncbi:MAG: hypothetical protein KH842_09465 [Firmicutes bacterium]|nr:hypothetical protein [Bacillota bacterium]